MYIIIIDIKYISLILLYICLNTYLNKIYLATIASVDYRSLVVVVGQFSEMSSFIPLSLVLACPFCILEIDRRPNNIT